MSEDPTIQTTVYWLQPDPKHTKPNIEDLQKRVAELEKALDDMKKGNEV